MITYDDVRDVYDTSSHPDVIEGKKTSQQVLNEFLQNFEKNSSVSSPSSDTEITPEEFERYYADISASIDDDDYFELLIVSLLGLSYKLSTCLKFIIISSWTTYLSNFFIISIF